MHGYFKNKNTSVTQIRIQEITICLKHMSCRTVKCQKYKEPRQTKNGCCYNTTGR